jgi:hypothetical protein
VLQGARGERPLLPWPLINGTINAGGSRPPFSTTGVLRALEAALRQPTITDDQLIDLVGPPTFPAGCLVGGDLARLAAGQPVDLTLGAQLTLEHDDAHTIIVISNLPPGAVLAQVLDDLRGRSDSHRRAEPFHRHPGLANELLPITDGRYRGDDSLACILRPGTDANDLIQRLRSVPGVEILWRRARLPHPLADIIRAYGAATPIEDLPDTITALSGGHGPSKRP